MTSTVSNRIWAVIILAGGLWGFGHKFVALVQLALDRDAGADAAFAVAPVVNYLLASMGFLCLVGWAVSHGMFHDIEAPKHTMLEVEARLDAQTHTDKYSQSIL